MADFFNRDVAQLGGVFTSDRMIVSAGQVPVGILQSTSFNYAQTVSKFYELSSSNVYLIGGRTNGSATVGHILGPKRAMQPFFQRYGDVCRARENTIEMSLFATDCDVDHFQSAETVLRAKFAVIVNVTIGVEAQQTIINSNAQIMFSSLEYLEGGNTSFR